MAENEKNAATGVPSPEVRDGIRADVQQSRTEVPLCVAMCLLKAEEILGCEPAWQPTNPGQELLCQHLPATFAELRRLEGELDWFQSIATRDAGELERFARQMGTSLVMPHLEPNEFAMASRMEVKLRWEEKGKRQSVAHATEINPETGKPKEYDGALVDEGVVAYHVEGHDQPIVRLDGYGPRGTEHEEDVVATVHLTIVDACPSPPLGLTELAMDLARRPKVKSAGNAALFPGIDLSQALNLSWLKGLRAADRYGQPNDVRQALQENKLAMQEEGCRAWSFAMVKPATLGGGGYRLVTVNRPFLCWIERKGVTLPVFTAYLAEDMWHHPGAFDWT